VVGKKKWKRVKSEIARGAEKGFSDGMKEKKQ